VSNHPSPTQAADDLRLAGWLRWATIGALVLAVAGLLLPGSVGRGFDTAAVVTVVAVPLLRVATLAVRWLREGDRRFALVAVALLAIVGGGALLSWLRA
jgi:cytochrome c oxidase subunit IV